MEPHSLTTATYRCQNPTASGATSGGTFDHSAGLDVFETFFATSTCLPSGLDIFETFFDDFMGSSLDGRPAYPAGLDVFQRIYVAPTHHLLDGRSVQSAGVDVYQETR